MTLNDATGKNYYQVIIDGNDASPVRLDMAAGAQTYAVASNLTDTVHDVLLFRITEGSGGQTEFLGFVIDDGNSVLGIISATKLDGYALRMTVTVRRRGESQTLVRATAQYQYRAVTEAETYQDFFKALSKAMFLTAHDVE